ncbi:hypothetical protein Bhyg_12584 [Pseudolycoriella hygida]|uniref:FAD-binding PCMH-type domain-containing protein n=1 Tax=Pseudolycoriella hygida TaxID=35572 RepID=A0A9Q0MZV0_9DIPT|nr:hypothetical protein Bhyg_12584 [Pseudolycoriella hygida]
MVSILNSFLCSCSFWLQVLSQDRPVNFPQNIRITTGNFHNWAEDINVKNLWIALPKTENDVVTLANWASQNNYKLRALGYMHNWSPLTVTEVNNKDNVVLVNTTVNLKNIKKPIKISPSKYAVVAQTGASMLQLLTFLEDNGMGMYSGPALGDLTVGGALAIGGHGAGVPAVGETIPPGFALGTISNLILSFKAVVWDSANNEFILKTFQRSDADANAFLVNFGRTFITEVTLMVGLNYNLRCESSTTLTSDELFASVPGPKTFSHFLDKSGRVETIAFPSTTRPWLKVWTIASKKPSTSRHVTAPFNYPIIENVPEKIITLFKETAKGNASQASKLGRTELAAVEMNLLKTKSHDLWGPSKNLMLYVKQSILKHTENGYAIITTRANVQKVLHSFDVNLKALVDSYKEIGRYPLNGPVVIRTTSVDESNVVDNSEPPTLSAIQPVNGHPEYDTVVWINVLSISKSYDLFEAFSKLETFMWNEYNGTYAIIRPEWSKGWAYTNNDVWSNSRIYRNVIPSLFSNSTVSKWNWAINTLNKYDPNRIFTNSFLDEFLRPV